MMAPKVSATALPSAAPAMAANSNSNAVDATAHPALRELGKRNEAFGTWTVVVRQANVQEYEYQWQGKTNKGKNCSCLLVSFDDPSEYCMGQMRWSSKTDTKFGTLREKFTDGRAFTMTKVSFMPDAKNNTSTHPFRQL